MEVGGVAWSLDNIKTFVSEPNKTARLLTVEAAEPRNFGSGSINFARRLGHRDRRRPLRRL